MLRSKLSVAVVGTLLFVASAFAAKVCEEVDSNLPGVDEEGNLEGDPGPATCRICINTKNNKFSAKCTGTVPNESGESQKYKNDPFFGEFDKSLYRVKANGAAKLTGKGVDA